MASFHETDADAHPAVPLVGSWEWDFATGSVTWSDGLFRLLGFDPGEVAPTYSTFMDMLHPEDRELVAARTTAARDFGEGLDMEFRIVHRDGEPRWVANKGEVFKGRSGHPEWAAGTLFDISHIRQAQSELSAREERYRALVSLNSIGEWRATPDGQQLECRFWSEFTGQSPEESQNHGWLSAVHRDDVSWVTGIYFEALQLGSSTTSSFRVRHHSGEYRWCLSKMLPLKNRDGSIREWIGAIEDVNQRYLSEELLQLDAERRGLALEAARMVAWDYDLASRRVQRSDNAFSILGAGSGPVDEVRNWVHPDDVDRVLAALARTEETGVPYDVEYRLNDRERPARWVRGRGKLLRNVKNGPDRVVGITFDITAQKEAERRDAQLTERLSDVESRYRALAAIAGDLVWTASTDGKLTPSPEWGAFTGQSSQEMNGWGWLKAVHPADREGTREALQCQAFSKRIEAVQYRLRTTKGDYVWVNSRAAPVVEPDGVIRQWIGVCQQLPRTSSADPGDVKASAVCTQQLISGAQVRASRGLLNWSVRQLAVASKVSVSTIRRIEDADGVPENREFGNIARLRSTFESAGVEFLATADGKGGVKLA
jgi:PAS domain S-box-containing protein